MEKVIYTSYNEAELTKLFTEILKPIVTSEVQRIVAFNNSSSLDKEEYLSRKEAALMLKISTLTLSKLVKQNIIKAKILGGSYRFSKSQIHKYLNSK